jgi:hypothetical protein
MANGSDSQNLGKKQSGIARAAMWLGGSALFGSLALVLWNRGALRSMYEAPEVPETPMIPSDDDIY